MSLYINDVLDKEITTGVPLKNINTSSKYQIGYRSEDGAAYFNGMMEYAKFTINGAATLYNFSDPKLRVGNTIIPSGLQNLIPNFYSPRWALHSNARPTGPDTLFTNGTAAYSSTMCMVPVVPNQKYLVHGIITGTVGYMDMNTYDAANVYLTTPYRLDINTKSAVFTADSTAVNAKFWLSNLAVGKVQHSKPMLYALDGREATIVNNADSVRTIPVRQLFIDR
jgi:hypothetical protein